MKNTSKAVWRVVEDITPQPTAHGVGEKRVLLASDETPSQVTQIAKTRLGDDVRIDCHMHPTMDEHYIFISGTGYMDIEGKRYNCREDVYLMVPAGASHSLYSQRGLEMITIGIALD